MESDDEPDKLHIQENSEYEEILKTNDEPIMYSDHCSKINAYGAKQERDLILSTKHIYNLKQLKIRRKIPITHVAAIIKSSSDNQFVIHIPNDYDFRFEVDSRDEFIKLLQLRFINLQPKDTLKIYIIEDDIAMYVTSLKDKKYGISNLPPETMRCKNEELAGTDDYKENEESYETLIKSMNDSTDNADVFTVKDDFSMTNSRENGQEAAIFEAEENKKEYSFDTDELISRQSVLIGSKMTAMGKLKELTLESFKIISVLGKGTFGKVYLTELIDDGSLYAIKAIRKDVLIETEQVESTKLERDILLECDHPFLCGMDYVFQNDMRLYFVMPFVRGGELYKHFLKNKRFPEYQVKFYAVQIAMAIGYLHDKDIWHRDLKLENILIDETGYLKLIDFGLAKILKETEMSQSFWGTPEYLAPEMVSQKGHDKAVDWWALGVLIYEMLIGVTPFYNRSRNLMLMKIQQSKIIFPNKTKYRIDYSDEVQDVIWKLLAKKRGKRLGSIDDVEEVLMHPWFEDMNIDDILSRKADPPFIPSFDNETDTKYFNTKLDFTTTVIPEEKMKEVETYSDQFKDFEKNFNVLKKD